MRERVMEPVRHLQRRGISQTGLSKEVKGHGAPIGREIPIYAVFFSPRAGFIIS